MQQKKPHLQVPKRNQKCIGNNEAYFVCCTKNCKIIPFICLDRECNCLKEVHKNCIKANYDDLLQRIANKYKEKPQGFDAFSEAMNKIYDEVVSKLERQRAKFTDWTKYLGLNQYERQVIKNIQLDKGQELTGDLFYDVYNHLQKTEPLITSEPSLVEDYWKVNKHKLTGLVRQLKNLYQRSYQLLPKMLFEHQKNLIKLFDKKPKKLIKIYDGKIQGFSVAKFHDKCDGVKDTLTVVMKADGSLAGGFSPVPWKSSTTGEWVSDRISETFKFKITNNAVQKNKSSSSNSVFHYSKWGPTFGGGRDFILYNDDQPQKDKFTRIVLVSSYNDRGYDLYCPKKCDETHELISQWWVFMVLRE